MRTPQVNTVNIVTRGLPPRYRAILEIYAERWLHNSLAPTIREVQEVTGISSTSVIKHYIHRMEALGLLETIPLISRGTYITEKGLRAFGLKIKHCPTCGQEIKNQISRLVVEPQPRSHNKSGPVSLAVVKD